MTSQPLVSFKEQSGAVKGLRIVSVLEALSWIGLIVGMYFKHAKGDASATMIPGCVHAVFFLSFLFLLFTVTSQRQWTRKTTAVGVVASIVPFCSIVFEMWAQRTGRFGVINSVAPRSTSIPS